MARMFNSMCRVPQEEPTSAGSTARDRLQEPPLGRAAGRHSSGIPRIPANTLHLQSLVVPAPLQQLSTTAGRLPEAMGIALALMDTSGRSMGQSLPLISA